jgi:hypothetical protein
MPNKPDAWSPKSDGAKKLIPMFQQRVRSLKDKTPSRSNIGEQNYIDLGDKEHGAQMLTGKYKKNLIATSQELQKEHCQLRYNEKTKVLEQQKESYSNDELWQTATTEGLISKRKQDQAAFIVDLAGNIHIRQHNFGRETNPFFHASFQDYKSVLTAGMIEIKEGKIIYMNNSSGHYKPTSLDFYNAIKKMKETMPEAFGADAKVGIASHSQYDSQYKSGLFTLREFLTLMEEVPNGKKDPRFEIMKKERKVKHNFENELYERKIKRKRVFIKSDDKNMSAILENLDRDQIAIIQDALAERGEAAGRVKMGDEVLLIKHHDEKEVKLYSASDFIEKHCTSEALVNTLTEKCKPATQNRLKDRVASNKEAMEMEAKRVQEEMEAKRVQEARKEAMEATLADFQKRKPLFSNKQKRDAKAEAMRVALQKNDVNEFLKAAAQKTRFDTNFQTATTNKFNKEMKNKGFGK